MTYRPENVEKRVSSSPNSCRSRCTARKLPGASEAEHSSTAGLLGYRQQRIFQLRVCLLRETEEALPNLRSVRVFLLDCQEDAVSIVPHHLYGLHEQIE